MKRFYLALAVITTSIFVLLSCLESGEDTLLLPFDYTYAIEFDTDDACTEAINVDLENNLEVGNHIPIYKYDDLLTYTFATNTLDTNEVFSDRLMNSDPRIKFGISDFCNLDEDHVSVYANDANGIAKIVDNQELPIDGLYYINPKCDYNYIIIKAESSNGFDSEGYVTAQMYFSGNENFINDTFDVTIPVGQAIMFEYKTEEYTGNLYTTDSIITDDTVGFETYTPFLLDSTECSITCCHNGEISQNGNVNEEFKLFESTKKKELLSVNACGRFSESDRKRVIRFINKRKKEY